MSTLRETLTEHLARRYWEHGMGGNWERPADAPDAPFPAYADDQEKAMCRAYVGNLLDGFDFPASPVRGIAEGGGITDAAVEAGAPIVGRIASLGLTWDEMDDVIQDFYRSITRAALRAAFPLLGLQQVPSPMLDRGRLDQLWGWAKSGKRQDAYGAWYYLMDVENVDKFTDHVMDLAVPVPTRAGIDEALVGVIPAEVVTSVDLVALRAAIAERMLALFSKPAAEPQCICHLVVDTYPDPDCPQYSEHVKPVEEES